MKLKFAEFFFWIKLIKIKKNLNFDFLRIAFMTLKITWQYRFSKSADLIWVTTFFWAQFREWLGNFRIRISIFSRKMFYRCEFYFSRIFTFSLCQMDDLESQSGDYPLNPYSQVQALLHDLFLGRKMLKRAVLCSF